MQQLQPKTTIQKRIILFLSILGLIVCIAVLFPQVRHMIVELIGAYILHRKIQYQGVYIVLVSFAMGGICLILLFNYCLFTHSGRKLVHDTKQGIKDCLSEIDFRSFIKPVLLMFGIYLLGILTIIRANFSYLDDLGRSINGDRLWNDWSRYISEFLSIFIHADTNLTEISPLPQLLAILMLSVSSVLLVYVLGDRKITAVRLLASIPIGLSPYFLGCLSYKYDAPYMALSVLASIVPFLFIARKQAFLFCSVVSLLVMCMTYQTSSGIFPLIVILLCFQDWNRRKKPDKETLFFLGRAAFAFCLALLLFRFFLMKPMYMNNWVYASNQMYPLPDLIPGVLNNIKNYTTIIGQDLGIIWKIGIVLVCIIFIIKAAHTSTRNKALSFFVSIVVIGLSFILSYGLYLLLANTIYVPRSLYGFGVFLAILCVYVVSDYKKIAIVPALALNWCFFVFAFSYGNALADQARYAEFRITLLLHDLSTLYPAQDGKDISILLENPIDYTPLIKNISKHYPVIEKLVPKRLGQVKDVVREHLDDYYWLAHFNCIHYTMDYSLDYSDLPVVLDSYYHTIKSDGTHCLIVLKH